MELTPKQFQKFQEFIYSACGIRLPEAKRVLLSNRLRRRVRALGLESFDDYHRLVTSAAGKDEFPEFLNVVTTNETFFFRTEKHFEWFQTDFINEKLQQARTGGARSLRVWSAACSTGEEPYSLAICLAQNQLRLRDWKLQILGTDLSEDALTAARAGSYNDRSVDALTDTQRRRYLKQEADGRWSVKPAIREFVTFQHHNLINRLSQPSFDCIFIRNVLIYFDRDSKRKVVGHLINALKPGGYLVVGPSEGIYDMLEPLKKHSTFLYQKAT